MYTFLVLGWFPQLESRDNNDVTVVTAYFNLGAFQKGRAEADLTYTPLTYYEWAKTFRYLRNPLIVYTDSKLFASLIKIYVLGNQNPHKVRFEYLINLS
jgi:hypothetical protein